MKILIFTEGTILLHKNGKNLSREKAVMQVIEKDESVKDYSSYIPIGNAGERIREWKNNGATIMYITSRTSPEEIGAIKGVLEKYNFPIGDLVYRKNGEVYANVIEKIAPDVLIEDNCESIGGENEMIYPNLKQELKSRIKSLVVKEFAGIDGLPNLSIF